MPNYYQKTMNELKYKFDKPAGNKVHTSIWLVTHLALHDRMLTLIPKSTNFIQSNQLKQFKQQHARHGARTPVVALFRHKHQKAHTLER